MLEKVYKYAYIVLAIIVLIILVLLLINLLKTKKKVKGITKKVDHIKQGVDDIETKGEYVEYVYHKSFLPEIISSFFIFKSIKNSLDKSKNLKKKTIKVVKKDIEKVKQVTK